MVRAVPGNKSNILGFRSLYPAYKLTSGAEGVVL